MFSTILEAFTEQARKQPDAIALLTPGKSDTTFGDLFDRNEQMRTRLSEQGIHPGVRVGIFAPTRDAMVGAFLAVATTAVPAPLSANSTVSEIERDLADMGLSAVVVEQGHDHLRSAVVAKGVQVVDLKADQARAGFFELEGSDSAAGAKASAPGPNDFGNLLRTSGTTGMPKIVPRTQQNMVRLASSPGDLTIGPGDRILNAMPLHHIQGIYWEFMYPLMKGASIAMVDFQPATFLPFLEQYRPTKFTLVPSMHRMVLDTVDGGKAIRPGSNIRWIESTSAALTPDLRRDMKAAYGIPVVEGYGSTETGTVIESFQLNKDHIPEGSVGRRAHEDVVIMDEEGNILPANTPGEICIKSEGNITGYLDNPEADALAFHGEFYRIGDQGYLDENDYLYVMGRVKDTINRGGEKIAPAEVDEVLLLNENVAQAAAFGVDHEVLGQDIWAVVVLKKGSNATPGEIRAYAATKLNFAAVPKRIFFVSELPYNEIGKVMRRKIAETYMS